MISAKTGLVTLCVAAALHPSIAQAAGAFEGTWVRCIPHVHGPAPYALLSVELRGKSYVGSMEWGSNYAASLRGNVVRGQLELRGCTTFRGEPTLGCSEVDPPVEETISQKMLRFSAVSDDALKSGRWIKAVPRNCSTIADRCVTTHRG